MIFEIIPGSEFFQAELAFELSTLVLRLDVAAEVGRRLGRLRWLRSDDADTVGTSAVDTAVLGLLGLLAVSEAQFFPPFPPPPGPFPPFIRPPFPPPGPVPFIPPPVPIPILPYMACTTTKKCKEQVSLKG